MRDEKLFIVHAKNVHSAMRQGRHGCTPRWVVTKAKLVARPFDVSRQKGKRRWWVYGHKRKY